MATSYYDYDAYEAALITMGIGVYMVCLVIGLIFLVLTLIGLWKIYAKAGKPGWASLVPLYREYCLFDIAWGSGWMFLLMFVPCVNFVISIILCFKLAKAFGRGTGFGFGLLFLTPIFLLILGFGNDQYIGPQ